MRINYSLFDPCIGVDTVMFSLNNNHYLLYYSRPSRILELIEAINPSLPYDHKVIL
jgi:hypothetical protein